MKSKSSVKNPFYDIIINIDSLKTYKVGWEIIENYSLNSIEEKPLSLVGIVGRENIGKTYLLNKLCEFNLPSGANVNTKGLSLKLSDKHNIICMDSAGIQSPVYYFDKTLMKRFKTTKEDIINNENDIKTQMFDDRTITDIFIQDFILEVCEIIIIVVGHLSQNDQKFIERIAARYKSTKTIVIVHNFNNLFSIKDVETKIKKDIVKAFDTKETPIPNTDVSYFIEKNNKKNIVHLVLGIEWWESGQFFNEASIGFLRKFIDTSVDKKRFNVCDSLKGFIEDRYPLYFSFKKRPEKVTIKKEKSALFIDCDQEYEISNPLFNAMGELVANPPYEVVEKNKQFIITIEAAQIKTDESLVCKMKKQKNNGTFLVVSGVKDMSKFSQEKDNQSLFSFRKFGAFSWKFPLSNQMVSVTPVATENISYKKGVLKVEVFKKEDEEIIACNKE